MNDNIFRKKSLDRISSPEQLTDYIRVSNPGVWVVLGAVTILLISALIWSVFGVLPDTLKVNVFVQNGSGTCYVDEETSAKLATGMVVQIGKVSGTITEVTTLPVSAAEVTAKVNNDYTATELIAGDWNYPVKVDVTGLSDGLYEMVITVDSIKPISFIWN